MWYERRSAYDMQKVSVYKCDMKKGPVYICDTYYLFVLSAQSNAASVKAYIPKQSEYLVVDYSGMRQG